MVSLTPNTKVIDPHRLLRMRSSGMQPGYVVVGQDRDSLDDVTLVLHGTTGVVTRVRNEGSRPTGKLGDYRNIKITLPYTGVSDLLTTPFQMEEGDTKWKMYKAPWQSTFVDSPPHLVSGFNNLGEVCQHVALGYQNDRMLHPHGAIVYLVGKEDGGESSDLHWMESFWRAALQPSGNVYPMSLGPHSRPTQVWEQYTQTHTLWSGIHWARDEAGQANKGQLVGQTQPHATRTRFATPSLGLGSSWDSDWAMAISALCSDEYFDSERTFVTTLEPLERVNPEWAQRIDSLSKLEADWDGFGAEVISGAAVTECRRILEEIFQFPDQLVPQVFIAPLVDGGLELEWDAASGNELMVVIPPEGTPVRFLLTTLNASGQETERDGTIPQHGTLSMLLGEVSA